MKRNWSHDLYEFRSRRQVANALGISEQCVSHAEKTAFAKLRRNYATQPAVAEYVRQLQGKAK
jgi:DNA-directed RNA polymerase sigma subunit (sigma70/sigma32)